MSLDQTGPGPQGVLSECLPCLVCAWKPMGDCVFGEEESRHSIISSSCGPLNRMETSWLLFLGERSGGAWLYGIGGGVCRVPRARWCHSGCSPGLSLGPLRSGCSICSLCGDILEALKETACSCFLYSSSLSRVRLPALPRPQPSCWRYRHHPGINSAHVEAPHVKGPDAPGPVAFLLVLLQEGPQPGAYSQSALSPHRAP